ncbi:MAG: twin-arginine translocase subunit TatC [Bacteroidales bacterium]|jgi:sec-independent protein translocase protein TatC|nr:twin-arginine translocase subunit TatC [Bacteroidales bacterium]
MSGTGEKKLTFWDHLEELRWSLLRIAIVLAIFMVAFFFIMPWLFDNFILAPCKSDFFLYRYICKITSGISIFPDFCNSDFHVKLININLASQFLIHVSTSFWFGIIIIFPYIIFETWKFISPALYQNEKRNTKKAFTFGTVMFFIGCTIGYVMIFPVTLRFLAQYQISAEITNQISLNSYMSNFMILILIMGLVFELPLVSWFLSELGLLTKDFFKKYRKYAIVICLVLAAIITPSGDPFTLFIVFFPLYLLYELSSFFVKAGKNKINSSNVN